MSPHSETVVTADAPVVPVIVSLKTDTLAEELEARCPGTELIYACDFYVTGAEHGTSEPGGLRLGRILNVDHHAPVARMEANVTSTQLAYEHLTAGGIADPASCVVIHHTDCDSMLSSAMLLGNVAAEADLVAASKCADHTGEEHPVADLLQALDDGRRGDRTAEQYLESLDALQRLHDGLPAGAAAQAALDRRMMRRDAARELKSQNRFDVRGGLAFAVSDRSIDSAFFPALLPEAAVIMVACPNVADPKRWTVKVRRGARAPGGVTMHSLRIDAWDPAFGGRWNAGSNGRGGGTAMPPAKYADKLRARLLEMSEEAR